MEARIFCLGMPHQHPFQTPQISPFQNHHAYSCQRLNLRQNLRWQKGRGLSMSCGGGVPTPPTKGEINEEVDGMAEESKEDVIEKVELLEIEAIMGKDDGREAMDYKRRAGLFYKSSEMFQAIKDDHKHHHCT